MLLQHIRREPLILRLLQTQTFTLGSGKEPGVPIIAFFNHRAQCIPVLTRTARESRRTERRNTSLSHAYTDSTSQSRNPTDACANRRRRIPGIQERLDKRGPVSIIDLLSARSGRRS